MAIWNFSGDRDKSQPTAIFGWNHSKKFQVDKMAVNFTEMELYIDPQTRDKPFGNWHYVASGQWVYATAKVDAAGYPQAHHT